MLPRVIWQHHKSCHNEIQLRHRYTILPERFAKRPTSTTCKPHRCRDIQHQTPRLEWTYHASHCPETDAELQCEGHPGESYQRSTKSAKAYNYERIVSYKGYTTGSHKEFGRSGHATSTRICASMQLPRNGMRTWSLWKTKTWLWWCKSLGALRMLQATWEEFLVWLLGKWYLGCQITMGLGVLDVYLECGISAPRRQHADRSRQ
jgi:hypothetical protein